jgi:hypothetical protein
MQHRYLGLVISGAKNDRSALSVLEYFPSEKKLFLLDVFDRVTAREHQTSDEALLELLHESMRGETVMGVHVPLSMPPCLGCSESACVSKGCISKEAHWMRLFSQEFESTKKSRTKQPTAYTQRAVELWIRHQIIPELSEAARFEVDEALGGTQAPLTARMHYIKQRLHSDWTLFETWPKLSIACLTQELQLSRRTLASYRQLDDGVHARTEILERLIEKAGIFVYDRDLRKLGQSLSAFDSFICAFTALQSQLGHCHTRPQGFPKTAAWVQFPKTCRLGN